MVVEVGVPEGLAELPPGPGLAAALAGIDITQVANNQLLPVLRAQSRQAAHEAARLLGVIAEVGRANPTFGDDEVDRLPHPFHHAADEVRAALSWSRRAADREGDLAEQLVHELPLVYAAFLDGTIDRSKVRVFADHLEGLTPEQVQRVCEILVPSAGTLTPGQIAHRLRRLIAAIDPRHYEHRYRKALRDRMVCAWLDDKGAAVLSARGLTPSQAAAAVERVDLLAHAAAAPATPRHSTRSVSTSSPGCSTPPSTTCLGTRSSPTSSRTGRPTTTPRPPTQAAKPRPPPAQPAIAPPTTALTGPRAIVPIARPRAGWSGAIRRTRPGTAA